jgi:hypothetical protein
MISKTYSKLHTVTYPECITTKIQNKIAKSLIKSLHKIVKKAYRTPLRTLQNHTKNEPIQKNVVTAL